MPKKPTVCFSFFYYYCCTSDWILINEKWIFFSWSLFLFMTKKKTAQNRQKRNLKVSNSFFLSSFFLSFLRHSWGITICSIALYYLFLFPKKLFGDISNEQLDCLSIQQDCASWCIPHTQITSQLACLSSTDNRLWIFLTCLFGFRT